MDLKSRDKQFVWHPFTQAKGANVIPIISGSGAYVKGEDGNDYLDAFSSWWVNMHGHSHPYIAEKIAEQVRTLEHVAFGGFTHPKAVELAERIIKLLPDNYSKCFFSDNGSTSIEVALKMTMQYFHNLGSPKRKFIALKGSYHGDTFGSMSVSARGYFNEPFEPFMFDVHYIDVPYSDDIQSDIEKLKKEIDLAEVAGFIYEPLVQGASGMNMYHAEGLDKWLSFFKSKNIITIADEVMTGFGRTGTMFASEQLTVKPDIICLSKGITGGFLPMGLTVVKQKIYDAFYSDVPTHTFLHGHSYTGNALSCAAACANLDLFEKENTLEKIESITEWIKRKSAALKNHPLLRDVRCIGAIAAIELKSKEETSYFNEDGAHAYNYFLERGIILRPLGNVLVVIPPYCITSEEIDYIFDCIDDYIEHLKEPS